MPDAVNINDVLDGHVALEVECVDRLYLNAYVPILQVGPQVTRFLEDDLGFPLGSPALIEDRQPLPAGRQSVRRATSDPGPSVEETGSQPPG